MHSRAKHCNEGLTQPNKYSKTKVSKVGEGAEVRVQESLHTSPQIPFLSGVLMNTLTSPAKDVYDLCVNCCLPGRLACTLVPAFFLLGVSHEGTGQLTLVTLVSSPSRGQMITA